MANPSQLQAHNHEYDSINDIAAFDTSKPQQLSQSLSLPKINSSILIEKINKTNENDHLVTPLMELNVFVKNNCSKSSSNKIISAKGDEENIIYSQKSSKSDILSSCLKTVIGAAKRTKSVASTNRKVKKNYSGQCFTDKEIKVQLEEETLNKRKIEEQKRHKEEQRNHKRLIEQIEKQKKEDTRRRKAANKTNAKNHRFICSNCDGE